ncbi:MAG: VWA domain-containing protein, partial [Bacteroidota bacterium]|nr:VWA domain-containing protein [Bacteroidota bacterium]
KSGKFGTQQKTKKEIATELSAVLAFSAIQNNDKVGVIFFTDIIEKFIPPKKGKSHILRIIRELLAFEPEKSGTNISAVLEYFSSVIKKRSVCFILSDFLDEDFTKPLQIANKKHDIVAVRIHDKREKSLPNVGMIKMLDSESGKSSWVDTSSKKIRMKFGSNSKKRAERLKQDFLLCGVDHININTADSYIKPLINFFKQREHRR